MDFYSIYMFSNYHTMCVLDFVLYDIVHFFNCIILYNCKLNNNNKTKIETTSYTVNKEVTRNVFKFKRK